ncbi:hypothetical protein [Paenibacillus sp. GCM10012303]|jgi:hypothetical protein|uniref:hypothetical protein n=1 Tax=Paenibacillus sp. GCM10012303 TaxID=3317340 RepID=UPI00361E1906
MKPIYSKKTISSLLLALLLCFFMFTSAAIAATETCDNDLTTTNCSAKYNGSWTSISSHLFYLNNARILLANNFVSGDDYEWRIATSATSNTTYTYNVYLNYGSANATVQYYADNSLLTTLNQDTAPAGWSSLGSIYNDSVTYVRVDADNGPNSDKNTMADGIEAKW